MSLDFLTETALRYWEQLDSPVSLSLAILTRYGQTDEVLSKKVDPRCYSCPLAFGRDAAAVAFVKKNPFWGSADSGFRRSAAIKTWYEGEASCYKTNERFSRFIVSPLSGDAPSEFLRRVRRRLISWLGYGPSDEFIHHGARHGPGSTFSSSVRNPTVADKFSEKPTISHGAVFYLASLTGTTWGSLISERFKGSYRDCVDFTRGNRFVTVPKTALTDRSIAIEASINIYFQLAVGRCLRSMLLKTTGWNLDSASDIHRQVARQASIDGSFATIDLSNASDSLAKNLVKVLFADTLWLERMEDLRSTHSFLDKKWHLLEKFSSMGNGYTFELETCVFAALAAEAMLVKGIEPVLGQNLFVFGDDIIVPTESFQIVADVLTWSGFKLNPDKSFSTGSFRESCGGDFFQGVPVRGFYLKHDLQKNVQAVYTLHNGAKTVFENLGINTPWFLDRIVASLLDPGLRNVGGPSRLGDCVLRGVDPGKVRWRGGIRWIRQVKWSVPGIIPWRYFHPTARLACALVGHRTDDSGIFSRGHRPAVELVWVSDS